MRQLRTRLLLFSAFALATALAAAQDYDSQPSLGDVARQARLQKQKGEQAQAGPSAAGQNKDAPATNTQASDANSPATTTTPAKDSSKDASKSAINSAAPSKDAPAKDVSAKAAKKVITDDEISAHTSSTSTPAPSAKTSSAQEKPKTDADGKPTADDWKNRIVSLKLSVSALESQIQDLTDSIRYAGANCVANCEQWNQQQKQKQDQVEAMTSQLTDLQKNLEAMQESVRKQGFNSAVYDP
jgi:hypothetical protein